MGKIDAAILQGFVSAIIIGALIGIEREVEQIKKGVEDFAGLRTFIFISLLGAILGQLSINLNNYSLVVIGFLSFALIAIAAYVMTSLKKKKIGATTEITSLLVFSLGIMCVTGFAQLAIAITVIIMAFLAIKKVIMKPIKSIHFEDLYATVEFALVALVVLPLLPNKAYTPLDIPILGTIMQALPINQELIAQLDALNPYKIWLMVVLVSGISYAGYILIKIIGPNKGIGVSGMIGGIISSTAVGIAMTKESKAGKNVADACAFGVIFSSSTAFLKVIILIVAVNTALFISLSPWLLLLAAGGYLAGLFIIIKKKHPSKDLGFKSPFAILPAIKFGLMFGFIIFLTKLFSLLFGNAGVYTVSLISGFVGMNAITLSIASLLSTASITMQTAMKGIIVALIANTIFKLGYSWFMGERVFAIKVTKGLSAILAGGIFLLFLL